MSKVSETINDGAMTTYQQNLARIKARAISVVMGIALVYGIFIHIYPPARECRAKGGSYELDGSCTKVLVIPVD